MSVYCVRPLSLKSLTIITWDMLKLNTSYTILMHIVYGSSSAGVAVLDGLVVLKSAKCLIADFALYSFQMYVFNLSFERHPPITNRYTLGSSVGC